MSATAFTKILVYGQFSVCFYVITPAAKVDSVSYNNRLLVSASFSTTRYILLLIYSMLSTSNGDD